MFKFRCPFDCGCIASIVDSDDEPSCSECIYAESECIYAEKEVFAEKEVYDGDDE